MSEDTNLIALNNFQPRFDVRKEVCGGEDGFSLVLLPQVTVGSATLSERSCVHESLDAVVLFKECYAMLQFIQVKVWLDIRYLDVSL